MVLELAPSPGNTQIKLSKGEILSVPSSLLGVDSDELGGEGCPMNVAWPIVVWSGEIPDCKSGAGGGPWFKAASPPFMAGLNVFAPRDSRSTDSGQMSRDGKGELGAVARLVLSGTTFSRVLFSEPDRLKYSSMSMKALFWNSGSFWFGYSRLFSLG